MVHAGVRDYRVPPSILDLFVNHRPFYQRFHHSAPTAGENTSQFADELYAGSPSYLISAGGRPTNYSGVATVQVHELVGGITGKAGAEADRGVALPTTFMPTNAADSIREPNLDDLIQLGKFGTDSTVTNNMGVAPDFACGEFIYIPPDYTNDFGYEPLFIGDFVIAKPLHWTFIDHGANFNILRPLSVGGYYLAIYRFADDPDKPSKGFVEIYDTALHPGITFHDFVFGGHGLTGVLTKYGLNPSFLLFAGFGSRIFQYETQSKQKIVFSISGRSSDILSTSEVPDSGDGCKGKFACGTILNSEQGSGIIDITNPALGSTIRLDMHDQSTHDDPLFGLHHPSRRSESGAVESAGVAEDRFGPFADKTHLALIRSKVSHPDQQYQPFSAVG
jgi:hypothetical protein